MHPNRQQIDILSNAQTSALKLHIFIFVLAVVHVTFCALTIIFGGIKVPSQALALLSFIFMIMGIVYLDVNILFSTFLSHLNSYHIDDKLL